MDINNLSSASLSRRGLLCRAGLGGVALGAGALGVPLLAGCGGGATSNGSASSSFGLQLGWVANAEYSGFFMAAKNGHYSSAGVSPTIMPGGPNVTPEPIVTTGKALVAVQPVPENVANAVNHGADLKIIGAEFQKSPECWVSLADAPITQPSDIVGKKLGITLAGKNTAIAFLTKNGVDPSKVTLVPISFDPAPLVAREVDALWGLATNQPVTLAAKGTETHTMLLADYGFNRMQDVLITTGAALKNPDQAAILKKFVAASQQGWQDALSDPATAAGVTVNDYGKSLGLTVDSQVKTIQSMKPFVQPTANAPLLSMSDALISETISALKNIVGVDASPSLFTNELF
ncbi:hypothetical protein GCM10028801_08270 [Nocardioides maradonensis]